MKKIGLITMHRVQNFGSVLQAYATQHIIDKLGYDCTIIDYQYPNAMHQGDPVSIITKIGRYFLEITQGFPGKKKHRSFKEFREKYLKLSKHYPTRQSLLDECPDFDTYIVGSDQTWNTRHIGEDDTFLLNFVPSGKKRVSFSSSAAHKDLPIPHTETFINNLQLFSNISVRERNSQLLIKNLIGRDVPVTLDPTLLLTKEEWGKIAETSKIKEKIKGPFILAYILKYSFYPYPIATNVIKAVHNKYKLPVVCIRYSAKEKLGIDGAIQLNEGISPEDFLWLFKHAKFTISTSFHGTAFSLIFEQPFYSIVNPHIEDDRILSLLKQVGAEGRAIPFSNKIVTIEEMEYQSINKNLDQLRKTSIDYLKNALQ